MPLLTSAGYQGLQTIFFAKLRYQPNQKYITFAFFQKFLRGYFLLQFTYDYDVAVGF